MLPVSAKRTINQVENKSKVENGSCSDIHFSDNNNNNNNNSETNNSHKKPRTLPNSQFSLEKLVSGMLVDVCWNPQEFWFPGKIKYVEIGHVEVAVDGWINSDSTNIIVPLSEIGSRIFVRGTFANQYHESVSHKTQMSPLIRWFYANPNHFMCGGSFIDNEHNSSLIQYSRHFQWRLEHNNNHLNHPGTENVNASFYNPFIEQTQNGTNSMNCLADLNQRIKSNDSIFLGSTSFQILTDCRAESNDCLLKVLESCCVEFPAQHSLVLKLLKSWYRIPISKRKSNDLESADAHGFRVQTNVKEIVEPVSNNPENANWISRLKSLPTFKTRQRSAKQLLISLSAKGTFSPSVSEQTWLSEMEEFVQRTHGVTFEVQIPHSKHTWFGENGRWTKEKSVTTMFRYQLTVHFYVKYDLMTNWSAMSDIPLLNQVLNSIASCWIPNDMENEIRILPSVVQRNSCLNYWLCLHHQGRRDVSNWLYCRNKEIAEQGLQLCQMNANGKSNWLNESINDEIISFTEEEMSKTCCSLSVVLRDYQVQNIQLMLRMEQMPPWYTQLWSEFTSPSGTRFLYSPYLGRFRSAPLEFDFANFSQVGRGGILADEAGLGKTLSCIGLIQYSKWLSKQQTDQQQHKQQQHQQNSNSPQLSQQEELVVEPVATTLIIVPTTVLQQWDHEIRSKTSGLKVLKLYRKKITSHKQLIGYDVILTTYSILDSMRPMLDVRSVINNEPWNYRGSRFPMYHSHLHRLHFERVILDECHLLSNYHRDSKLFQRIALLSRNMTWFVSGTPIVREQTGKWLQDVNALLDVPLSLWYGWDCDKRLNFEILEAFCSRVIRHSANQPFNGRHELFSLPPCQPVIFRIPLDKRGQQPVYDRILTFVRSTVGMDNPRTQRLIWMQVWGWLRQMMSYREIDLGEVERLLDHWKLMLACSSWNLPEEIKFDKLIQATEFAFSEIESNCPVCLEPLDQPVQTVCGHLTCKLCISVILSSPSLSNRCPCCRHNLRASDIFLPRVRSQKSIDESDLSAGEIQVKPIQLEPETEPQPQEQQQQVMNASIPSNSTIISFDAKIRALVSELKTLNQQSNQSNDPVKSIVFSQYEETLGRLSTELEDAGIIFARVKHTRTGDLYLRHLNQQLQKFKQDPKCNVLLLILGSVSVGLNLQMASVVYFMEPSTSQAVENQAVARVRRMGQIKSVVVKYLTLQNTFEEALPHTKLVDFYSMMLTDAPEMPPSGWLVEDYE